jgi:hypothetical protein
MNSTKKLDFSNRVFFNWRKNNYKCHEYSKNNYNDMHFYDKCFYDRCFYNRYFYYDRNYINGFDANVLAAASLHEHLNRIRFNYSRNMI